MRGKTGKDVGKMQAVFAVLGLVLGACVGLLYPGYVPQQYLTYVAVALLAAFDSVLGGINAHNKGKFSLEIFASGFFINTALAALLTYLGQLLQINLYFAAIIVFGTRIFQNLAEIRRFLLNYQNKKDKMIL
jgi:small basic protein